MSGICGILKLDGTRASREQVLEMSRAIAHRGPDRESLVMKGPFGLAHRLLAVGTDSQRNPQPTLEQDHPFTCAFDGEIQNAGELHRKLQVQGESPTRTEEELLAGLYEREGVNFLESLEGAFALALYDSRDGALLLARDRIGLKPVYYYSDETSIRFSSEIKGILADVTFERAVDLEGLNQYFSFGHCTGDKTLFKGIRRLEAGQALYYKSGVLQIKPYWDLPEHQEILASARLKENAVVLCDLLEEAVKCSLPDREPVGAFLSGGLDSATVAGLATRLHNREVATFSMGLTGSTRDPYLEDARQVADELGTRHHEILVEPKALLDAIHKLAHNLDEPLGYASILPTYLLYQSAREHVRVMFSGAGADELFGGHPHYRSEMLASRLSYFMPRRLWSGVLNPVAQNLPRLDSFKKLSEMLSLRDPLDRKGGWLQFFSEDARREIFQARVIRELEELDSGLDSGEEHRRQARRRKGPLRPMLFTDLKTWVPHVLLEKIDKASSAAGIQVRLPFLQRRIVEFADSLPEEHLVWGQEVKRILRSAAAHFLPSATLRLRGRGYALPMDSWLSERLDSLLGETLEDGAGGLLDPQVVRNVLKRTARSRGALGREAWLLIQFNLWYRCFIGSGSVPRATVEASGLERIVP